MAGLKFKEGEYIVLADEGGYPLVEYAKGHINAEQFAAAYLKETGVEVKPDFPVRHIYGRWAQTAMSRAMDWAAELQTYEEPGPGRFKMSAVRYNDMTRAG